MRSRIDLTNVNAVANWLRVPLTATLSATEQQQMQLCITAASAYWLWRLGVGLDGAVPTQSPLCEAVSYNEAYDGNGKTRLWLRNRPILSVQNLQIDSTIVPLSAAWNQAGYVIDQAAHSLQLRAMGNWPLSSNWYGVQFTPGVANVIVQYTAGFAAMSILNELQTIPATPGPYLLNTLKPALADIRIRAFVGGAVLTPVTIAPASGQYFIADTGQYQFAAADQGAQVLIDYSAAGTPPDIQMAATHMVAINYKRRDWIDQKQQSMGGGVTFQDWELPPAICSVMNAYRRMALV